MDLALQSNSSMPTEAMPYIPTLSFEGWCGEEERGNMLPVKHRGHNRDDTWCYRRQKNKQKKKNILLDKIKNKIVHTDAGWRYIFFYSFTEDHGRITMYPWEEKGLLSAGCLSLSLSHMYIRVLTVLWGTDCGVSGFAVHFRLCNISKNVGAWESWARKASTFPAY